ncbi:thiamine-phosphate kinase [Halobacterium salinarum]|uniref:thiamine-phosphate kinase n=1 Tax=Halobacterium salinarum TaxID=2242 RepID=UPI00255316EB|nr:thiamine-phosphate kinase [Halobacterium salinarum]MDL0145577.1 thiamine-phosphate kinase [Halobacterium salinarum]
MDERAALELVGGLVSRAGDDAAVVGDTALTIDMLHDATDFPSGTTRYTAGWRSVGASLSDVAATGATATAAVAAYGAPGFDDDELAAFVTGARDVCTAVGAEYVGGDLDGHSEFTVATAAIGDADHRVTRSGARPGDSVVVTGSLGRSAAAMALFDAGDTERANDLFQFMPRVAAGRVLGAHATAMMDASDGLARSLHQLAAASDCGMAVDSGRLPVADALAEVTADPVERAVSFGGDFELVAAVPRERVEAARAAVPGSLSVVGRVTAAADGVRLDGDALADDGWTH